MSGAPLTTRARRGRRTLPPPRSLRHTPRGRRAAAIVGAVQPSSQKTSLAACFSTQTHRPGPSRRGRWATAVQQPLACEVFERTAVRVRGGGRAACASRGTSPAAGAPRLTVPADPPPACGGAHPSDASRPPGGCHAPPAAGAAAAGQCQQPRDGRSHPSPQRRVVWHPPPPRWGAASAAEGRRPTQGPSPLGIHDPGARPCVTRQRDASIPPTPASMVPCPRHAQYVKFTVPGERCARPCPTIATSRDRVGDPIALVAGPLPRARGVAGPRADVAAAFGSPRRCAAAGIPPPTLHRHRGRPWLVLLGLWVDDAALEADAGVGGDPGAAAVCSSGVSTRVHECSPVT